jgi:phthiocerol/phenolphthiocerol synthesis type-I polyketide synthase C
VLDVFAFDAPFVGIRPDEAKYMDPQVRQLLEVTWEALESAGVRPKDISQRRVGVFTAAAASEYAGQLLNNMPTTASWAATGITPCMSSNRISWFYDLVNTTSSARAEVSTDLPCFDSWGHPFP